MQENGMEKLEKPVKTASNTGLHVIHNFFTKILAKSKKRSCAFGRNDII